MKILIAEDESGFALILRRTLEKNGHVVTVTTDGAEAWAALEREEFPLVISDWMMPKMSGPALCRRIRARVDASYTYVILLTSRHERQDRMEGLYSGADDFIKKPLERGELLARLAVAQRILVMQEDLQRRSMETVQLNDRLRRQNEQVTALNAELEQFACIACHDLQEPLRKIQIFSSRLTDKCGDTVGPQGHDFLDRIHGAAERMQALIRDLFALTQVDRSECPFVAVDLGQVAREVVTDLEARLEETLGRVEIGDLPTVLGDPLQIRQLLQNLIDNALKYHRMDESPLVTLAISAETTERVWFEVADNGIGFEEQYLTQIFAPFQRLHSRSEYEGLGIGLAICKKIMDRHGGVLTARSTPGRGATFVVDLPRDSINERDGQ